MKILIAHYAALILILFSCSTDSVSKMHNYNSFWDESETILKSKGNYTIDKNENPLEVGEWLYFDSLGNIEKTGNFNFGSQFGTWRYNKLFLTDSLVWDTLTLKEFKFSYPSKFDINLKERTSVRFIDKQRNIGMGLTLFENKEGNFGNTIILINIQDFTENNQFISSTTQTYSLQKTKYEVTKMELYKIKENVTDTNFYTQYYFTKDVDNQTLLFLISAEAQDSTLIKFLGEEIFSHTRYKGRKIIPLLG